VRNKADARRKLRNLPIDFITHLEGSAGLLRVFEGDKAVAGLPLLIRELAVSHGEKLFVQVASLFDLVKLVVRGRRQEQGRWRLWQQFITNGQCSQASGRIVHVVRHRIRLFAAAALLEVRH